MRFRSSRTRSAAPLRKRTSAAAAFGPTPGTRTRSSDEAKNLPVSLAGGPHHELRGGACHGPRAERIVARLTHELARAQELGQEVAAEVLLLRQSTHVDVGRPFEVDRDPVGQTCRLLD